MGHPVMGSNTSKVAKPPERTGPNTIHKPYKYYEAYISPLQALYVNLNGTPIHMGSIGIM